MPREAKETVPGTGSPGQPGSPHPAPVEESAPDERAGRAARMAERLTERRERHLERSRATRIAIVSFGFVLVLAGIVLSGPGVPGPGFLVILIGLGFLALEFEWAERLLRRGLRYADAAGDRASNMSTRRKVAIAALVLAVIAAAIAAVFVFDIPVPVLNPS